MRSTGQRWFELLILVLFLPFLPTSAHAAETGLRVRAAEIQSTYVVAPGSSQTLTAYTQHSDGTPIPGLVLQFTAPAYGSSGTFPDSQEPGQTSIQVETDATGAAVATFITNDIPGVFLVEVHLVDSAARNSFAFTNLADPPAAAMGANDLKTAVQQWLVDSGEVVGSSVLLHGPVLLPAGTVVSPAFPPNPASRELPVVVEADSWLLWIDDIPFADFEHATRYVLIDASESGPDVMRNADVRSAHWWPVVNLPDDPTRAHSLSVPTEPGFAVDPNDYGSLEAARVGSILSRRAAAPQDACAVLVYGPDMPVAKKDLLKYRKYLVDNELVAPDRVFGNISRETGRMEPVTKTQFRDLIQTVSRQGCKKVYFMFVGHGISPDYGGGVAVASETEAGKSTILSPQEYVDILQPLGSAQLCIVQVSCFAGFIEDWIQGRGFTGSVVAVSNSTEVAYHDRGEGHFFLDAFLQAKGNASADTDGDGKVSDIEATDWVSENATSPFTFPNGQVIDRIQTPMPGSDTISPVSTRRMTAPFLFIPNPGTSKNLEIRRPTSVPSNVPFTVDIRVANETVATPSKSTVTLPPGTDSLQVPVAGNDCNNTIYQLSANVDGQLYFGENRVQVGHFRILPDKISMPVGSKRTVDLSLYGGIMRPADLRDATPTKFDISSANEAIAKPVMDAVDVPIDASHVSFMAQAGLMPGTTQFSVYLAKTRSFKTIQVEVYSPAQRAAMDTCLDIQRQVLFRVLGINNPFHHPITLADVFDGNVSIVGGVPVLVGGPKEFTDLSGTYDCMTGQLKLSGNSGSQTIAGYSNVPATAEGTLKANAASGGGDSGQGLSRRRAADNGATIELTYTLGDGVFPGGPISWTIQGDVESQGGCDYALNSTLTTVSSAGGAGAVFVGTDSGCTWNATSSANWLTLSDAGGDGPGVVEFQLAANTDSEPRSGTITIGETPITITQDGAASQRPIIFSAGVVNGASFTGGITSGSWISILGANLSPTKRAWLEADFNGANLPTSLDGVSVTINGRPAYIYYIDPSQLNVLAPDDETIGLVKLVVTTPEGSSDTYEVYKLPTDPALFQLYTAGRRYAVAVHADGSLVAKSELFPGAAASPGRAGEAVMFYGTGFGRTDPPVPSAQLVARAVSLARPIVIRIGGRIAEQQYAGLVGSGLVQLNAVIPDLPPGDYLVEIYIDGVPIQQGVYITIGE